MKPRNSEQAFTLIELLIVIVIISILVSIALPSYQSYTKRAHYTEIVEAAEPLKLAVEQCFQFTGDLNDCTAGHDGIPEDHDQSGRLVQHTHVGPAGKITIIPQKRYGITPDDDYQITPAIEYDTLIWHAGGGGVQAGYAQGDL